MQCPSTRTSLLAQVRQLAPLAQVRQELAHDTHAGLDVSEHAPLRKYPFGHEDVHGVQVGEEVAEHVPCKNWPVVHEVTHSLHTVSVVAVQLAVR